MNTGHNGSIKLAQKEMTHKSEKKFKLIFPPSQQWRTRNEEQRRGEGAATAQC
jgi:hypothetical protein